MEFGSMAKASESGVVKAREADDAKAPAMQRYAERNVRSRL